MKNAWYWSITLIIAIWVVGFFGIIIQMSGVFVHQWTPFPQLFIVEGVLGGAAIALAIIGKIQHKTNYST